MKDDFSCKTDLLDSGDSSDEFIICSPDTVQPQSPTGELWNAWNSGSDVEDIDSNEVYDRMLRFNGDPESSADSKTFVPESGQWSLAGSMRNGSLLSNLSYDSPVDRLPLPGINDEIFGFRLLFELGTGSFAKVFLARQGDLADREVVLKISAIEGSEPQTLAQLQHTHVVPIYSVHEDQRNGLRAVCMPYFGGASLSKVLERIWSRQETPRGGKDLVDALEVVSGPEPAVQASRNAAQANTDGEDSVAQTAQTARDTLAGLSFIQAAVWITARLAEGLQHSHERNVIHRDVKPSNILMSAEGQPLLLDYNVSQGFQVLPEDEGSLGGTIAYMAPEHLRAAMSRNAANIPLVNQRSDVFSLGLVLYEMLTGSSPFKRTATSTMVPQLLDAILAEREQPVASLKKTSRLDIPWSLESIVRKSLAVDPRERYASAAQFAEDLNRFLTDLPLKYAPELSRREQVQKWVRRHPRVTITTVISLMAAMFIVPGGVILAKTLSTNAANQKILQIAETENRAREFRDQAPRALSMVNLKTPDEDKSRDGMKACEATLGIYGVLTNENWQDHVYWQLLSAADRKGMSETVRELLMVLAKKQVGQSNDPAKLEQALQLLNQAERIRDLDRSKLLLEDRANYLALLHRGEEAEQTRVLAAATEAKTAHDKYMLATVEVLKNDLLGHKKAVALLTEAVKQDPKHYWSYFERAICYQDLDQPTLAASDLGMCVALWPDSSWAHFNRGHLLMQQGLVAEALEDYSASIRLSPKLRQAYFNRGLAHLELQKHADALKDFDKVIELGRHDEKVIAGRAMALEGLGRHDEADPEFEVAMKRSEMSTEDGLRIRWTYGMAIAERHPARAQAIFDEILQTYPNQPQACYGCGVLAMQKGELKQAIGYFDKAIDAKPNFAEALRYRAIALARNHNLKAASDEIAYLLDTEETHPDTLYAAACVSAIGFRQLHSPGLADKALELLAKAIVFGTPKDRAVDDLDFSALRFDPDFLRITGSTVKVKSSHPQDL